MISKYIRKRKKIIAIILLGIVVRLIFSLFFNHAYDYFGILALVKSVADTGNLAEGFYIIKKVITPDVQFSGKIYYQIAALWLLFLEKIRLVDIKYLFDNKAFDGSGSYLTGLLHWGPYLYQLIAIKLIQFVYDFIFLFFLVKITQFLYPNNKKVLLLTSFFWALNPLIIFASYALFQSDLAMIACLIGGVYYALIAQKNDYNKTFSTNKVLAMFFFALGAVIKQVPLLFAPVFMILISNNIVSFLINALSFILSYFIFAQPWSSDSILIKTFFLNSHESLALFNFNLNGISVFLFSYLILLFFSTIYKKKIVGSSINLIKLSTILLALLYLSEDTAYLYTQFNTWILPFIFFLVIDNPLYCLFIFAPVLGFYKRAIGDTEVMVGSLAISLGTPLLQVPPYEEIISRYTNPSLINYMMTTMMGFLYILLILLLAEGVLYHSLIFHVKEKLIALTKIFTVKKIIVAIFIVYFSIVTADFIFRSQYVRLTNVVYKDGGDDIVLAKKPIVLDIDNPNRIEVSGFLIKIIYKGSIDNSYITFTVVDKITGQSLVNQKVYNVTIPGLKNNILRLYLDKKINNRSIRLKIFTDKNNRNVFLSEGQILSSYDDERFYNGYDDYYKNPPISFKFINSPIVFNLMGSYDLIDASKHLGQNYKIKPTFFKLYFGGIILMSLFSLILLLMKNSEN